MLDGDTVTSGSRFPGNGSWRLEWGQCGTVEGLRSPGGDLVPLSEQALILGISLQIEFTAEQIEGKWRFYACDV